MMEPEEMGLERLAYEAYCEKTGWKNVYTRDDFPPFDRLLGIMQAGWIAAAQAIKVKMKTKEAAWTPPQKDEVVRGRDLEAVMVPRKEYEALQEDSRKLSALEGTGVDNWEGYDIAMEMLETM